MMHVHLWRHCAGSTDDDSSEDSDEDEGSRRKHNLETTGVVSRGRLGKPQDATAIRNLKVERMARAAEIKASLGFGTSMGKAG